MHGLDLTAPAGLPANVPSVYPSCYNRDSFRPGSLCVFVQALMLSRLFAAATAGALVLSSCTGPAQASDPDNVRLLAQAITDAGVELYTACPEGVAFAGMYASTSRAMAVCADDDPLAEWSADEQDTLRHEGIHLAQDCMARPFDGDLETTRTISNVMRMMEEASDIYDFERIEHSYRRQGADDMTVLLEFEAWAGAAIYTNAEVADLVRRACRVN